MSSRGTVAAAAYERMVLSFRTKWSLSQGGNLLRGLIMGWPIKLSDCTSCGWRISCHHSYNWEIDEVDPFLPLCFLIFGTWCCHKSGVIIQGTLFNQTPLVGFSNPSDGSQRRGTNVSQTCAHVPHSGFSQLYQGHLLWGLGSKHGILVGSWEWRSPLETWVAFQGQLSFLSPST